MISFALFSKPGDSVYFIQNCGLEPVLKKKPGDDCYNSNSTDVEYLQVPGIALNILMSNSLPRHKPPEQFSLSNKKRAGDTVVTRVSWVLL